MLVAVAVGVILAHLRVLEAPVAVVRERMEPELREQMVLAVVAVVLAGVQVLGEMVAMVLLFFLTQMPNPAQVL